MIKLGLVGCGGIASFHSQRFAKNADRMKLVATADVDLEKAIEVAEVCGAEHYAADFHDILPHVDALLLAVPHYLHHDIARDCMLAGKDVLLEKPMCITEEDCIDLIEIQEKTGQVLMIGYTQRYHPITLELKRLMDEGVIGDVFHMSMWTEQHSQWEEGSFHHYKWGIGGGQFISHGCHYIDLALWMMGNPVMGTHVGTNYGTPWMEKEGTSDVFMKFESGAVFYHFGTWGARGTRHGYAFHAHGTTGMLEVDQHAGKIFLHKNGEDPELLFESDETSKPMDREMAHFLDCIETRQVPFSNGPDSLQGLRVIWKLYEAEEKNGLADLKGMGLNFPWR